MTVSPRSKGALRRSLSHARRALDGAARDTAQRELLAHLRTWSLAGDALVAVYAALPDEVSLDPWLDDLTGRGVRVAYPRVEPPDRLRFSVVPKEALVCGTKGIREPPREAPVVPLSSIDAFVVPGVGFTADGARLGYGGGFYDRILAEHPKALRVAVAFELQVCLELPIEPHDARMDALVTERGWRRLAPRAACQP